MCDDIIKNIELITRDLKHSLLLKLKWLKYLLGNGALSFSADISAVIWLEKVSQQWLSKIYGSEVHVIEIFPEFDRYRLGEFLKSRSIFYVLITAKFILRLIPIPWFSLKVCTYHAMFLTSLSFQDKVRDLEESRDQFMASTPNHSRSNRVCQLFRTKMFSISYFADKNIRL